MEQDKTRTCPVCGAKEFSKFLTCRITAQDDLFFAGKDISLARCRGCGVVFVHPLPEELVSQAGRIYSKEYFSPEYMRFYVSSSGEAEQSNEPFSWRLSLIKKHISGGRLLDIGCAAGGFIKEALKAGWQAQGVEVSAYAASLGINQGLNIFIGRLEDAGFAPESFDVVTIGELLEHIPEPKLFLARINRILKPGGIVYIAVPNMASLHYILKTVLARVNYKNYFVLPHHLYHYSPANLKRLVEACGFNVIEQKLRESRPLEKGWKRRVINAVFFAAKMIGALDRIIILGRKPARG